MLAWRRSWSLLARFGKEERGVVLILVVLLLVPLMLVMAGVIDYSRTFLVKRQLTNAVDAAALALGGLPNLNDEEAEQKARAFIETHYPPEELGELTGIGVVREGEQIDVTATARVDMSFIGLVGIENVDITVNARAIRKDNKLEVAMVLDNTGSMGHSNKIQDLRAAARSFVDILFAADDADEFVKVGLVPFTNSVRLDAPPAAWLDIDGESSIHAENLDLAGKTLFAPEAYVSEARVTAASPETGRGIYEVRCAACHGADARGTARGPGLLGPALGTAMGREAMRTAIRFGVAEPEAGYPPMAGFADLTDPEIGALISHLRRSRADGRG